MFGFGLLGLNWTTLLLLVALFQICKRLIKRIHRAPYNQPHAYKDKKVIITGASSGIGEAIAKEYAARGAILILAARRKEALDKVADECSKLGAQNVIVVECDVSIIEGCKKLIETTLQKCGGLDMIVLNAGIGAIKPFEELELPVFRNLMDVNYFGCVYPTHFALPYLKRSHGKIVVISSLAGKSGVPRRTAYSASKHALHGFYDSLRYDLGPKSPVQITLICPGYVLTEMHDKVVGNEALKRKMSHFMSVKECAELVLQAEQDGEREMIMTGAGWLLPIRPFLPYWFVDRVVLRRANSGFQNAT